MAAPGPDQLFGSQQKAWCAEAALECAPVYELLLQRRQGLVLGQAFDRRDRAPVGLCGEQEAGAHRPAVQQHRAGAADALLAAEVRPGQPDAVPYQIGQREADGVAAGPDLSVDPELY